MCSRQRQKISAASARDSPAATQSSFALTNDVLGRISTDGAGAGGLAGFSTDGVEGVGISAALATVGGIEDAPLTDEFVAGFSAEACAFSTTGFAAAVAAATKDCGLNGAPLLAEPLTEEAFSAWSAIERGCP